MKKVLLTILAILVILAGIVFAALFFIMGPAMQEYKQIDYATLDVSSVPDGVYRGEAEALLVQATVDVHVRSGSIESIDFVSHRYGLGGKAEAVADEIVRVNHLDVDEVSGASASSTVIKAAVYDALEGAARP